MNTEQKLQLFLGIAILSFILAIAVPFGLFVSSVLSTDSSCANMEERQKAGAITQELEEACDEENTKMLRNIAIGFGVFIIPAIGFGIAYRREAQATVAED